MGEKKNITAEDFEKTPKQLHEDIIRQRSDINETIGLIIEKFSTEHLKHRLREEFLETRPRAKRLGSALLERIKENPVPAAMAGIGLAMLFAKKAGESGFVREKSEEWKEKTEETIGEAKGKITDIRAKAEEKKRELSEKAHEKAQDVRSMASERTYQAKGYVQDFFNENPIAVLAGAFILGAAIGLSVPETQKEEELFGEAGEKIREQAKKAAHKAEEKIKAV